VEASYCGLPTRRDRFEFEEHGGFVSKWADLRLTLSASHKLAALPPAHQFPDVLPLRVNESATAGKVIPMRPRHQAKEA